MNAEQYLDRALSGNMNIGTLKLLAWLEIIEGYARLKVEEALKPPHNKAMPKLPTLAECEQSIMPELLRDGVSKRGIHAMIYDYLCRQLSA